MTSFSFHNLVSLLSPVLSLAYITLSSGEWKEGERDEGMRRGMLLCPVYLPLLAVQNPGHLFNKSLKQNTEVLSL